MSDGAQRYRLSELVNHFLLVETECWAVLHLVCLELEQNIRIYLESGLDILHLPEYIVVTRGSILLHTTGEVSLEGVKRGDVSHLVPDNIKPLLEFREEDWRNLGLHSLARTMISCIHGDNLSTEMIMFFRSILNQNLSSLPTLSDIILYLRRKIKTESATRLVSSLCYKLQAVLSSQDKGLETKFTSSESALKPSRPGWMSGTVSCPSLLPVSLQSSTASIDNFINNNDVFAILELPGLRFKGRRTNGELSSSSQPEVYVPGYIRRRQRPALQYSLLEPGSGRAGQIVRVVLLTGHRIEVTVDKMRTKVKDVLRVCLEKVKVREEAMNLFGLFSSLDEEYLYLDPDSLLVSHLLNGVLTLYLRFIRSPEYEDLCPPLQHLLYLQLRQDLVSGDVNPDPNLAVQLGLLAVQVEVQGDHVRLEPEYFLPRNHDNSTRLMFQRRKGVNLTGSIKDAQALFCGLVSSSEGYSLYRYWGRENRGEGSRRISLQILPETFVLAGQSYSYTQVRQISYSQSYLQVLVKTGEELKRMKIFFPDNKPKNIHDLMMEFKDKHSQPSQPGVGTRTRRSLGVVCNQIVGVAKEVGRSIRTPKRARSLSTDPKIGGKKRKLSFGSSSFAKSENRRENKENRRENKENCRENKENYRMENKENNRVENKENLKVQMKKDNKNSSRVELQKNPGVEETRTSSKLEGRTETKERVRVRMGTRMVGEGRKAGTETERRILQVKVGSGLCKITNLLMTFCVVF